VEKQTDRPTLTRSAVESASNHALRQREGPKTNKKETIHNTSVNVLLVNDGETVFVAFAKPPSI